MADSVEHLSVGFWPLACSFREIPVEILCPFIIVLSFIIAHFRHKSLPRYVICKYFLPFCGLSLHFLGGALRSTKIFFHPFFHSLSLIGIFMPFTFKIIADIIGLISFVLLPAFYTFSNYNGAILIILFYFLT